MSAQRKNRTPGQRKAERRWRGANAVVVADGRVRALPWIIGVIAGVYLLQLLEQYALPALGIQNALVFWAPFLYPELTGTSQPWRILTAALLHGSFIHVGLNLISLWMIGRVLEPLLGTGRFLALFVLTAAGGSLAVTWLGFDTPVLGASGAVFGLFGTFLVIARRMGGNITGILILLGVNLVLGFLPFFNISWQAHIGGLAVGLVLGVIFSRTSAPRQRGVQIALLVVVAIVIALGFVVPAVTGFPVLSL